MGKYTKTNSRSNQSGFSPVIAIAAVLIIAGVGIGGWYVMNRQDRTKKQAGNTSQLQTDDKKEQGDDTKTALVGWKTFNNDEMGVKFIYPNDWSISEPEAISTAGGEEGQTITIQPNEPAKGDPSITLATYPSNASIRYVDARSTDVKLQDIRVDAQDLSLVGEFDDITPLANPSHAYLSSCWPRSCTPKLKNGRWLSVYVTASNPTCEPRVYCPTEINQQGDIYKQYLQILESATSL